MIEKIKRAVLKKQNIPVFCIILVALFFRLYKIDEYLTFLGDEGRDVLVVLHILHGNLTLLGPTASVGGFFLGPIYYYMMAPFLFLFNYDPVGPAVMVALVGTVTVWLLYKVSKEFFGYLPALLVSLLYAISPLVVVYSRSSWNPNVVPFFALLLMYLLYKSITQKSSKMIVFSGITLGILLQLHYLSTFLAVMCALYILFSSIFQNKKPVKILNVITQRYAYFAVGTVIGWSPFLAFEIRHGFPNIQSILKFVFTSGDTGNNSHYFQIVQDVFLRVFGRLLISFPKVEDLHLYPSNILQIWGGAAYLIGIASIFYIVIKLIQSKRKKEDPFYRYLLLFIWIVAGVILFGFYKKPIYDYYFGILFPVPFLLLAGLLEPILGKKDYVGKVLIGMIFLIVVVMNLNFRPFKDPGNHQLDQVRSISEFVLSKTQGQPYNFAVISSGGNSDFAYRYFFETHHMPPVTIQFPGIDPDRKTVTDQLLIVCETLPCYPLGYPLWEVAGFGQAEIDGEWNVSVLKVYRLVHYKNTAKVCIPGKACT